MASASVRLQTPGVLGLEEGWGHLIATDQSATLPRDSAVKPPATLGRFDEAARKDIGMGIPRARPL
jgi:hypothetical protein